MTLFEVIVHFILWPFNAAVYTYNVLALATGSQPPLSAVMVVGAIGLLVSAALALRRGAGRWWEPVPRDLRAPRPPARVRPRRDSAGGAERVWDAREVVVSFPRERTVRMFGSGLRQGKSSVDTEARYLPL